ncbi:glpA [Mytilus coruscus]|uniref:glycerol-3-phosphate dehydrogenase n=1 Tax=Mytilus coruscus TaxID=42192 RepID=A0A6J8E6G0_MYTCO|nr:glpA [Mytilus coruscus]
MDTDKKYAWSPLPTREDMLKSLETEHFDVLVIGGGATGTGVALDATSRALKTAMVEKYDFSCGTSSRSTKLIHGVVRYLQKAVFNLDLEQVYGSFWQHDDARMNIAIAISTARMGGSVANYMEVLELHKSKDENGKEVVSGARVKDRITDREFNIKAKCVINATGPYTDHIRLMGNKEDKKKLYLLPDYYR